MPFSSLDSSDPEDMWAYLEDYEERLGGKALAIPHNGNLSGNRMFAFAASDDRQANQDYAKRRARFEPLYEVTQIKGDGESHPLLSPNDEFADYEIFRWGVTLSQPDSKKQAKGSADAKPKAEPPRRPQQPPDQSYARSALKLGLGKEAELGVNPFKFGMIGSTDSHSALATADQDNFWGKMPGNEPSRNRVITGWNYNAAGYAAVWATQNTREALFAAMRRKEVYASTGPRITVRFFGGWDFAAPDELRPDLARVGYAKGVPMGGDLTAAPEGEGADLPHPGRKGSRRRQSGSRASDKGLARRRRRAAREDIQRRPFRWSRGERERRGRSGGQHGRRRRCLVYEQHRRFGIGRGVDRPDFGPDEHAFYYLRVLEIPTPRWTAYDARFYGLENLPDVIPMVAQQRAYTSPIWYTPM